MWALRVNRYSSSFYKWIQNKEFRKDHRAENDILNKKIQKRSNTKIDNIKNSFKQNQDRLKLFVGFGVIFSLGFIYDYYLPRRHYIKKIEKRIKQLVFGTDRVYNKSIAEVDRNWTNFQNKEQQQIGDLFRKIDKKYLMGIEQISPQLCSSLGIQTPVKMNLPIFFKQIRKSNIPIQHIRDNMMLFSKSNQIVHSS